MSMGSWRSGLRLGVRDRVERRAPEFASDDRDVSDDSRTLGDCLDAFQCAEHVALVATLPEPAERPQTLVKT